MSDLRVEDISKSYAARAAVDRVHMEVAAGDRIVLWGPSGCGKTTLLRLIAGLEIPDSGAIEIGHRIVAEAGRNVIEPELRNIGMVFQDLALWPHMTVREHLEFALRYRKQGNEQVAARVHEMLRLVRLTDQLNAKPHALQGGQQQRVALARALVGSPEIVLMDEPLSNADRELSRHLRAEILRLHAEMHFPLIYVTHNEEEAEEMGVQVFEMRDGKLTQGTRAGEAPFHTLSSRIQRNDRSALPEDASSSVFGGNS